MKEENTRLRKERDRLRKERDECKEELAKSQKSVNKVSELEREINSLKEQAKSSSVSKDLNLNLTMASHAQAFPSPSETLSFTLNSSYLNKSTENSQKLQHPPTSSAKIKTNDQTSGGGPINPNVYHKKKAASTRNSRLLETNGAGALLNYGKPPNHPGTLNDYRSLLEFKGSCFPMSLENKQKSNDTNEPKKDKRKLESKGSSLGPSEFPTKTRSNRHKANGNKQKKSRMPGTFDSKSSSKERETDENSNGAKRFTSKEKKTRVGPELILENKEKPKPAQPNEKTLFSLAIGSHNPRSSLSSKAHSHHGPPGNQQTKESLFGLKRLEAPNESGAQVDSSAKKEAAHFLKGTEKLKDKSGHAFEPNQPKKTEEKRKLSLSFNKNKKMGTMSSHHQSFAKY